MDEIIVVRCKDCKRFVPKPGFNYMDGYCRVSNTIIGKNADGYCDKGVRKDA